MEPDKKKIIKRKVLLMLTKLLWKRMVKML